MLWLAGRAYHRRRGWLAWHIAALGRADPKRFPQLATVMGEAEREAPGGQQPAQTVHAVRMWKAALGRKFGDRK